MIHYLSYGGAFLWYNIYSRSNIQMIHMKYPILVPAGFITLLAACTPVGPDFKSPDAPGVNA